MELSIVHDSESMANVTYLTSAPNDSSVTNTTASINVEPPVYIVVVFSVLFILVFLIGIVGNILVIIVITLSRSMKTSVNMYLMNLCFADVLVLVVCMPTALTDIFTKEVWYFGGVMCKLVPTIENTVANVSVLTILAISVERYRVVCYPLQGIGDSGMKIAKIVTVIWCVAIASCVPFYSIPEQRNSKWLDGTPVKVCRNPVDERWEKMYTTLLCACFFCLPCILLFALNIHLCRVLHVTGENALQIQDANSRYDRRKRQHQVVNIIASIVTIFFLCHLPFRVMVLWFIYADIRDIRSLGLERYLNILYFSRVMFYMNHALNPVIYNFVSTKFRCALRDLLTYDRNQSKTTFSYLFEKRRRHSQRGQTKTVSTRQSVANWTPTKARRDSSQSRLNRNDFHKDYKFMDQSKALIKESSTSSTEKNYDVKIEIENRSVAIKFKLEPSKPCSKE